MEKQKTIPQPQINIPQVYVNTCKSEMTNMDASLMMFTNQQNRLIPQIELKMTPVFLKMLSEQLSTVVKNYEKQNGKIQMPKVDKSAGVV